MPSRRGPYDRPVLAGRDTQRERLLALLGGARRGTSAVLVIRGEAGVGKSALLDDVVAGAKGMTVLRARGVESEADLPYAALHRLLRRALGSVDTLAPPQADALRAAFGLATGRGEDRFLVSLAVLSLLAELGERQPVLCVVDDAHWLDGASAHALTFMARRLEAESVALLFAVRDTQAHHFPADDLPQLRLAPLDAAAAAAVLSNLAGAPAADAVVARLLEVTGGNPLALVELAGALDAAQLTGERPLPVPLPLTAGVEQAFLDQVRRLPEPTRTLLLVAAADDTGRLRTIVGAAAALGVDPSDLGSAERAGVVRVDGAAVEFRHPLVRSVIYQSAPFTDRRAAHLALAGALDGAGDADRRAWHRASAAVDADPDVAADLEAAAGRARARGGFSAAVTALERAAELTAPPALRGRRMLGAAEAAWLAGQTERARSLLDRAAPLVDDPSVRAEVEYLRGTVELGGGEAAAAYRILWSAAERMSTVDPPRALEVMLFAGEAASSALDSAGEVALGRLATRLDAGTGARERCMVDLLVGFGHHFAGDPVAAAAPLRRAIAAAADLTEPHLLLAAGRAAFYLGDDEAAHRFSAAVVGRARDAGEVGAVPIAGNRLALAEIFAGRLTAGRATAAETVRLSAETGQQQMAGLGYAWMALHAAIRGNEPGTREYADRAYAITARHPMGLVDDAARWAEAVLHLGLGDPAAALGRLREVRHPVVHVFCSLDRIEAAWLAGDRATAWEWQEALDTLARHTGQPWALARAAHARALLADGADADRCFAEALDHHERAARPFERARTELAFGAALRRARRRTEARTHLRAAHDRFESLGAALWTERARGELRASGQTVRRRVAGAATDQLTPQELQVALFVTRGLSNAEVAAQLFLSRRTVDFHLRNVFAKLGVTSRTELVRLVPDQPAELPVG
jgi:DNA-binding CsgD family transcriptional regulator